MTLNRSHGFEPSPSFSAARCTRGEPALPKTIHAFQARPEIPDTPQFRGSYTIQAGHYLVDRTVRFRELGTGAEIVEQSLGRHRPELGRILGPALVEALDSIHDAPGLQSFHGSPLDIRAVLHHGAYQGHYGHQHADGTLYTAVGNIEGPPMTVATMRPRSTSRWRYNAPAGIHPSVMDSQSEMAPVPERAVTVMTGATWHDLPTAEEPVYRATLTVEASRANGLLWIHD